KTYRYFDLPFCSPDSIIKEKNEALGEVLNGDRLVSAPYKLNFRDDKESAVVCRKKLSKEEVVQFRNAVEKDYYFQMKTHSSEYKYFIYKHIQFDILYNKDRVIEISTRMDPHFLVDLTEDKEIDVDFMYAQDEEAADDQKVTGWKYIHGDVFRFPKYKSLFAAALGYGTQLFTLNLLLTKYLFCGPLFLTFCFLNTITIAYSATAALPFGTIVVIVLIWTLFQTPCRTTKYPQEILSLPWYKSAIPQMAMAGFLPFSAIYIELYYIFASVWGHMMYTIYNILFIVFIILLIVTTFITVALTYFQFAAEDHEWWWRSFLCSGSTGVFIYAYCLYYYYACLDMSGFMQTSFFFGYMACICYGFFLMLGTIGF
ncbi:hypothetical protein CICLE_v10017699mg, partial [Citrus x clementina]